MIGRGLYIVMLSVHGLIRGHDLELGRDADTGGQTTYVVELARALAAHRDVERVDLVTRLVEDSHVDHDYAVPVEQIGRRAFIVRVRCGPRRYLRKETLWPYLDEFASGALRHIRSVARPPDVIHSHYADAGRVGVRLSSLLGVPLVHTGHSLGRLKRERLLEKGLSEETIESRYNMAIRIEAEEETVHRASLVIASTHQELDEQWARYDNFQRGRGRVIPPGIDLARFRPPRRGEKPPEIARDLERFLSVPSRPMVLALSRADERKNLATLVHAFATNERLRRRANLVIVAGTRDDLRQMEKGPREVLTSILFDIDRHDLYGSVAFPKRHESDEVPAIYRLATRSFGVFVNPALTEPFGLTLLEAAASGLPIVATRDGGPRDIIRNCHNGVLVDPLDPDAMGEAIRRAISDHARWRRWSRAGIEGVRRHYSWEGHVRSYLEAIRGLRGKRRAPSRRRARGRLSTIDRLLVCDIDNTLIGDSPGLRKLLGELEPLREEIGFAVATGRRVESAIRVLQRWSVPTPDVLITSVGSEIHWGHRLEISSSWRDHIRPGWEPDAIRAAMRELPGLELQSEREQREFKISYEIGEGAPGRRAIERHIRRHGLRARVIHSHARYLDLLPLRASKGRALRFLAERLGIPLERILVAGDSGNDEEMLVGPTLGVVVGNYSDEIEGLRGRPRIYFAEERYAYGVLEGIEHYDFFRAGW